MMELHLRKMNVLLPKMEFHLRKMKSAPLGPPIFLRRINDLHASVPFAVPDLEARPKSGTALGTDPIAAFDDGVRVATG
jgi:hypothetical protein